MAKYNVSMAVDLRFRFDVVVEADSFKEAFEKAKQNKLIRPEELEEMMSQ